MSSSRVFFQYLCDHTHTKKMAMLLMAIEEKVREMNEERDNNKDTEKLVRKVPYILRD